MSSLDDTQQYTDLIQLYSTYGDVELKSLALNINDLTNPAQQALKSEFSRRGLTLPAPDTRSQIRPNPKAESQLNGFDSEEGTFEFTDLEDAYLAQSVLRSAGIESVLPSSELGSVDMPRLIVAPTDAEAAQLILSSPNLSKPNSEEGALFVEPVCPKCGAKDPLLESVEPTNHWRCEACNHTWQDKDLT